MKASIVDRLSSETVLALTRLGLEVEVCENLSAETLPSAIAATDILIVRSTKVSAKAIEAARQLSLIIRQGRAWITST